MQLRKRIGEAGIELILKESIRVSMELEECKKAGERKSSGKGSRGRKPEEEQTVFIDTTVQEKNVTFPTDSKLLNKIIKYCHDIAGEEGIKLHQTFAKEIKELKLVQRFRGRSHSAKKVRKADKRMRTIVGILLREITRSLPEENPYKELLDIFQRFVNGEKYDGHTIDQAMEQVRRIFGRRIRILAGDRGYRGETPRL